VRGILFFEINEQPFCFFAQTDVFHFANFGKGVFC